MKIGTCIRGQHLLADLKNAIATGFDTVELYFNETLGGINFKELSTQIKEVTGYYSAPIHSYTCCAGYLSIDACVVMAV